MSLLLLFQGGSGGAPVVQAVNNPTKIQTIRNIEVKVKKV